MIGYCTIWNGCSDANISPNQVFYGATNYIHCPFSTIGSKEIPNNFEIEFIFPSMVWKQKNVA